MSSLSSWSLSDLFMLLLLAILPRVEKKKGHPSARECTVKHVRTKDGPPPVPYQWPPETIPRYKLHKMCIAGAGSRDSHRRLAIRLLLRPIPRHFSRWGAKREAAILRLQLGQTHSLLFHWLKTCPKMSNPGWSTISGDRRGVAIRVGRGS